MCVLPSAGIKNKVIKNVRGKKKEDKLLGAREVCRFHKFQLSSFPCLLGSISNDDGDGNENGKKPTELDIKTKTLHVLFTLFCTFLCRHCTTMTWKWLISYFEENLNTRQRLSFSLPDLRYSLLEFRSGKICQHLTNWTRWDKHRKVWSNANSLFLKVTFSQPLPPLLRKLPIG